jgi:Flp pilus assembly protein TadB
MVGGAPALLWWAAVLVLASVGVVLLRRRYARRLRDIAQAREALRAEVRALRAPGGTRDAT